MDASPCQLTLTAAGCRVRQERLRKCMREEGLELVVLSSPKSLQYFANLRLPVELSAFALFDRSHGLTLVVPGSPAGAVADEIVEFDARDQGGPHNERYAIALKCLGRVAASRNGQAGARMGIEQNHLSLAAWAALTTSLGCDRGHEIGGLIRRLRRHKDEDEVELFRASIAATEVAYRAGLEAVRPGATELDVFNAMHEAAIQHHGSSLLFEGDFACGMRGAKVGGPPLDIVLQEGDLYILDIFPQVYGYRGDLCRTFAVGEPSAAQRALWETVSDALHEAEKAIAPGVRCRDIQQLLADRLKQHPLAGESFWHHGGHGIGLDPHESPRITFQSEDVFEVGDVFTLEPGLYHEDLGGGVRLEQNYRLTSTGLERLSSFPLDLFAGGTRLEAAAGSR